MLGCVGEVTLQYLRDFPHYLILVDAHYDASDAPYRYIPQEDLELLPEGTKVPATSAEGNRGI